MNNDSFKDYYKILQVDRNAVQEEIAIAYKSLAKKYHPDLNFNNLDEANEKMKTINEAYNVLNNAESRIKYNLTYDLYIKNNINNSSVNNNYNSYVTRKDSKEYIKKENIGINSFFKLKKRNMVSASIIAIFFICMLTVNILISNDYTSTGEIHKNVGTSTKETDRMREGSDNNHLNNSNNYSRKSGRKASSHNDRQTNDIPQQDER